MRRRNGERNGASEEKPDHISHLPSCADSLGQGKRPVKIPDAEKGEAEMTVEKAEEIIRIRLSKTMREKRITPAILARKTGISESVIRGYIQEGVVPTAGRLAVICEALKLDIAWVCGLKEE